MDLVACIAGLIGVVIGFAIGFKIADPHPLPHDAVVSIKDGKLLIQTDIPPPR